MIPARRRLDRFRSSFRVRRFAAGRLAGGRLITVLVLLGAGPAGADPSTVDTDLIYAAIAGVVVGPPLLAVLVVKRLRGVLPWLASQVVWIGLLTVGFQVLRAVEAMR